jgi:hypothetical protein
MDRKTTVISKCQLGFIDFIVLPLYEVWDKYLVHGGSFPALKYLKQNKEYWKRFGNFKIGNTKKRIKIIINNFLNYNSYA